MSFSQFYSQKKNELIENVYNVNKNKFKKINVPINIVKRFRSASKSKSGDDVFIKIDRIKNLNHADLTELA